MGRSKLSPTPWCYLRDTGEIVDLRGLCVVTSNDPTEQVHSDDLEISVSDEDGMLMAAAPDLLESLLDLLELMNKTAGRDDATRFSLQEARKRAINALAKAGMPIE